MSKHFVIHLFLALSLLLFIFVPIFAYNSFHKPSQILSAKTQEEAAASPVSSPSPSQSPKPSVIPSPTLSKTNYTIALFGDSFIDTMGENFEYLEPRLKAKYPQVNFSLYNYGIGSQNVKDGLNRFESPLNYKDRHFPPIGAIHADVIVLGSFAYNPFSPHDRNRHYLDLIELANKARSTGAAVYMLAEIAPRKNGFGKGPNEVNWPPADANNQAAKIIEQLEDAVNAAKTANIPLINAFYPSQTDGNFGNPSFVNTDDGIHPSVEGHSFMADLIVKSLNLK